MSTAKGPAAQSGRLCEKSYISVLNSVKYLLMTDGCKKYMCM